MKNFIEPIDSRVFRCACRDRDHWIEANHEIWNWKRKNAEDVIEEEITLTFKLMNGDWESEYRSAENTWNRFLNWKGRMFWRLKKAWIILWKGYIELEDCWTPIRNDYKDKNFMGEKELQDLINWLQDAVNQVKKNKQASEKNKDK